MFIPPSLIGVVICLGLGFVVSMGCTIQKRGRKTRYQKLGSASAVLDTPSNFAGSSYQSSSDYAVPKQKIVTYNVNLADS